MITSTVGYINASFPTPHHKRERMCICMTRVLLKSSGEGQMKECSQCNFSGLGKALAVTLS